MRNKILVCHSRKTEMADCALNAGALGMISVVKGDIKLTSRSFPLPVACVTGDDLEKLKAYMNKNR